MGFRIFALCLRQVLVNWRVALRVSWFWGLVSMSTNYFLIFLVGSNIEDQSPAFQQSTAIPMPIYLASLAVYLIAFAAIAIGWHRYILREEEPDRFYVIRAGWPVARYVWKSFLLLWITATVAVVLVIALSAIAGSVVGIPPDNPVPGPDASPIALIIFHILVLLSGTIAIWLGLRLGLGLPAMAVGKKLSFAESFKLTEPIAGSALIAAFCIMVLGYIPVVLQQFVGFMGGAAIDMASLVWFVVGLAVAWLVILLGIGILTVAYGHVAENRPL